MNEKRVRKFTELYEKGGEEALKRLAERSLILKIRSIL